VAGTTDADAKVSTSNHGSWVDVSAPGEDITTTFDGGGYGASSGTSLAAPFAAGLAGLLRSQHPGWSAGTVRAQIVQTTDDIDSLNPGYEGQLGSGRIDAGQALSTAAQPDLAYQSHTVDGEANGRPEPGSTVDLVVTLSNDWADATNVQATLSSSDAYVTLVQATSSYGAIAAYGSGANATPFRFSVSGSAPPEHDMLFNLHVTADGGYSADIPLTIPTSAGITYAEATITTRTWTSDRTYVINKETGIAAGEVLTIEAGTTVYFDGYYNLNVAGTLIADGTEEQPIIFASKDSDNWGRITFLDSSVDAVFDSQGKYVSGSILRHTHISGGEGISGHDAAPYLAHNMLEGGGITCPCDGLHVEDNQLTAGTLEVSVGIAGPEGQTKPLLVSGNTISGGKLKVFTGGYAPVLVTGNQVRDAPDIAIEACGVSNLSYNRVEGAVTGIDTCSGLIAHNLVASTTSRGIHGLGGATSVLSNTIVPEQGYAVEGIAELHHNNLVPVPGEYSIVAGSSNVNATGNWWGTTDEAAIQAAIYDGSDEFGLGVVDYSGYLSNPAQEAPAYVQNVTISPDTTLGIQTAAFDLTFSRPMDQSVDPQVSFHPTMSGTWAVYSTSNSDLPANAVLAIAVDHSRTKWFGTTQGVARFLDCLQHCQLRLAR